MDDQKSNGFRVSILKKFGANRSEIEELLAYNANVFDHSYVNKVPSFPLADEPFVAVWQTYMQEARDIGVFQALKKRLVQLNFAIQEGMSDTGRYKNAIRKGERERISDQNQGLHLDAARRLELKILQTPAGKIPVIIAFLRQDFISLLRALACKNEPRKIPLSMGASFISGYNNWDRIYRLKEQFLLRNNWIGGISWDEEFQNIIAQKELYQDKFILLSRDFYSGISPEQIGLTPQDWLEKSIQIRMQHEATHYFMKRVLRSSRNNLLDELIADFSGIKSCAGEFQGDWFLLFMGMESHPDYRVGGRLENYRGSPALSDGAFHILQKLVYSAVNNLAAFDAIYRREFGSEEDIVPMLLGISHCTLEQLASEEAESMLSYYCKKYHRK